MNWLSTAVYWLCSLHIHKHWITFLFQVDVKFVRMMNRFISLKELKSLHLVRQQFYLHACIFSWIPMIIIIEREQFLCYFQIPTCSDACWLCKYVDWVLSGILKKTFVRGKSVKMWPIKQELVERKNIYVFSLSVIKELTKDILQPIKEHYLL